MTVPELLARGRECQQNGDAAGAEAAYREADAQGDAEGAILLGMHLRGAGRFDEATGAFARAEERGHVEAASCLGNMLWDQEDFAGARTAFERAERAGSADAAYNLGLLLAQLGDPAGLPYLRRFEAEGDIGASWSIGRLLEGQGDTSGALAAYQAGAAGGDSRAAFDRGALLFKANDREGARAAFERAQYLGHPEADGILASFGSDDKKQRDADLGRAYAAICVEIWDSVNACLEKANRAFGARNTANMRPQHPISIQSFTTIAEEAEREFAPAYRRFADAVDAGRRAAANLLATQPDPDDVEFMMFALIPTDVLDTVAAAKAFMMATFNPTPAGFIEGINQSNQLMKQPMDGNIYRPAAAATADERTCPWCAETIKSAARICRFCNRDVTPT